MTQLIVPFVTLLVGFLLGVLLGGICVYVIMEVEKDGRDDSRLV